MFRERITITLEGDLLKSVDQVVDRSTIRNRSHAIEHLLKEGLALHELTKAVIVLNQFSTPLLPTLAQEFAKIGIIKLYLITEPGRAFEAPVHAQSAKTFVPELDILPLPGEFGTGGALAIAKPEMDKSFLYCNLFRNYLPKNLLPMFTFHRRSGAKVTQLLTPELERRFSNPGISFIHPDALDHIPAGVSSVEDATFPALLKLGTLVGYVNQE